MTASPTATGLPLKFVARPEDQRRLSNVEGFDQAEVAEPAEPVDSQIAEREGTVIGTDRRLPHVAEEVPLDAPDARPGTHGDAAGESARKRCETDVFRAALRVKERCAEYWISAAVRPDLE